MKLTDTQLLLLSKATQHDGFVLVPPNLKGAVAAKVFKPLLENGLIQEVPSTPDMPAWRRDEVEGRSYALVITSEGRGAINAAEDGAGEQPEQPAPAEPAAKARAAAIPAAAKVTKRKSVAQEKEASPRAGSKLARVMTMLTSKAGTTIDAIVKATDWLPHTTRAALTGLRKRGYRIEKERRECGRTTYRIVGRAGAGKSRKESAKTSKGRKA
jgi:hypothetical protein